MTFASVFHRSALRHYAPSERRPRHDRGVSTGSARSVRHARRALPSERAQCLAVVLAAFAGEAAARWVWPDDARYAECAPLLFGALLDLRLAAGEGWVSQMETAGGVSGAGVAALSMWNPPGGLYDAGPDVARGYDVASAQFTAGERAAWKVFDEAMAVPASAGPHWFLGVVATMPAAQGTGLGRAVTAPMLAAADRAGLPTYLETGSDINVAIYRRWGFDVETEVQLPDGPLARLMRRGPHASGESRE